ncbi:GNAT family N-acetyltransferase [Sporolactobacillus sp. THM7-4]|nr:GNAT family N-acetyltransferase [Sporolactobacillus sp. THM7-4]
MLIRYKKSYEKIAMGLLSFVPSEKEIKTLLQTIKRYEEDEKWQLFLWKDGDDIIGVIGVQLIDQQALIEHLSVNPSYRAEGIGREIILALGKVLGENVRIVPSSKIKPYFDNCFQKKQEEKKEAGE